MGLAVGADDYALLGGAVRPAGRGRRWRAAGPRSTRYQLELEHEISSQRHVWLPGHGARSPSPAGGGVICPLLATVVAGSCWPPRPPCGRSALPVLDRVPAVPGGAPAGLAGIGRPRPPGAVPLAGDVLWFHGHTAVRLQQQRIGIDLWVADDDVRDCAVIQPPAGELVRARASRWRSRPARVHLHREKNSPLNSVPRPEVLGPQEHAGAALRAAGDRRPAGQLPR